MKLYIGMTVEEATRLFSIDDITNVQDMKNGYYWIRGWYYPFGERTYSELCFKDGLLWMVILSPHFSVERERPPFSIDMADYRYDQDWVNRHKDELPEGTEAYYEYRTPSVGIVIR